MSQAGLQIKTTFAWLRTFPLPLQKSKHRTVATPALRFNHASQTCADVRVRGGSNHRLTTNACLNYSKQLPIRNTPFARSARGNSFFLKDTDGSTRRHRSLPPATSSCLSACR
jgi:hypothetical protein